MATLRAVTFDVDGTLFDFRAMRLAFAWPALRNARFLRAYLTAREEVRKSGAHPDLRRALDERVAVALGVEPARAAALREKVIEKQWMRAFSRVRPIEGVRQALLSLSRAGLALATISDYPARPKLLGLGLADLPWAADVSAEDLGALKPHPRAFQEAVKLLGVAPHEALHVGDRMDADVAGALNSGMRAALFTGGNRRRYVAEGVEPELVFGEYRELLAHIGLQAGVG